MSIGNPFFDRREVAALVRPLREVVQDLLEMLPEHKPYTELGQAIVDVKDELNALTREVGE